ncbi:hypothetical protein MPER_12014, partial [Moniliophthora perniciosa FA553]
MDAPGQHLPLKQPFWDSAPPPRNQALNSKTFCPPPLDGTLTLPEIYDWHREHSPHHRIFTYAREDGSIRNITYSEIAPAIYRATRLISILSTSETVSFFTTQLGIMRGNFVPFPISPRNSAIAVAHLIAQAKVRHVLVGEDGTTRGLLEAALDLLRTKYASTRIPDVSSMLIFDQLFSNLSTTDDGKDLPVLRRNPTEVALYLHSSGSTSQFPKLIPWSVRRMIELFLLPYFGERDLMANYCAVLPAGCGAVLACFEPQSPPVIPTADNLAAASRMTGSDFIFSVPSFVEEWSHQPESRRWLATRSGVIVGGGTLNKECGHKLVSEGIALLNIYGMTEAGVVNPYLPKRSLGYDWDYFEFAKNVKPELIPQGDGTFELVLVTTLFNNPSILNTKIRGEDCICYIRLGDTPSHEGRLMESIWATNPGPLESILNQDPHVQTSVFFGRERFQAGLLIQPVKEWQFDPELDQGRVSDFRNKIWPTVERMNEFAPQHSRIFKE